MELPQRSMLDELIWHHKGGFCVRQDPKAEVMIFGIERQKGTITCVTPESV